LRLKAYKGNTQHTTQQEQEQLGKGTSREINSTHTAVNPQSHMRGVLLKHICGVLLTHMRSVLLVSMWCSLYDSARFMAYVRWARCWCAG
jgi:hypothetical protein